MLKQEIVLKQDKDKSIMVDPIDNRFIPHPALRVQPAHEPALDAASKKLPLPTSLIFKSKSPAQGMDLKSKKEG